MENTTYYLSKDYIDTLLSFIVSIDEPIRLKQLDDTGDEPEYFITDNGQFVSLLNGKAHYLSQEYNSSGYKSIKIRGKRYLTHREVANAFLVNPHPEERKIVHHIDGNKDLNYYTNLRFIDDFTHKLYHKCKEKYKDCDVELQ